MQSSSPGHRYPGYAIDGNQWLENQSINWYQSIKLFSNWYWLVSVNQWSIDNHTKTFHRLLSIGTATSNRHQARFLSDHLPFLGSPGDDIPIQSSQSKEHTPLHMYLNYSLAFPRHTVHAKSWGGGFTEYKVHHQRLSSLLLWGERQWSV